MTSHWINRYIGTPHKTNSRDAAASVLGLMVAVWRGNAA